MSPNSSNPLRFGIVSSDPLRLLGFETLFPRESGFDIVSLVQPKAKSLRGLSLVVVDATCTDLLFEMVSALRKASPSLCIIVVGLETDLAYVETIIGAGVKGYLTHAASEAEIRMAIDIVLDGSIWAPRKVLARLLEKGMPEKERPRTRPVLTPREKDVLRLLVQGSSNKEIGTVLTVDAAAVKAHIGRLMRKLGVANRTALGVETMRQRLLD